MFGNNWELNSYSSQPMYCDLITLADKILPNLKNFFCIFLLVGTPRAYKPSFVMPNVLCNVTIIVSNISDVT